jgi:hypothetical protein
MTTNFKHRTFETMIQTALDSRLHEMSRRRLFRNAAIAGGSMAALGSIGFASAQDGTPADDMAADEAPFATPVDVLNYALTLEHLESAFYRDGLAEIGEAGITGLGFDASVFTKLSDIAAHEADHVTTLTTVITDLGGEPVAESTCRLPRRSRIPESPPTRGQRSMPWPTMAC